MSDEKIGRSTIPKWTRPTGPPCVWRIIEGKDKVRFSIQEIPEDRYQEAIEHMCKYFIADETTCKSLKLAEDPDAINDFKPLWDYLLRIGISVGAYTIDDNDKILKLAGINILFVVFAEIEEILGNFTASFKSTKARKLFEFMNGLSEKADPRDIYKVDRYLSALGLSIAPAFRGQKLGVHLLEIRNLIGRKYDLTVTSTIFTGLASQIQATRAAFETVYQLEYSTVLDEDGKPFFPDIETNEVKVMVKLLR